MYLKASENQEQTKLKTGRKREIIKIRTNTDEIETTAKLNQ